MKSHPGVTADFTEALRESELVILATEWQEFRDLDPAAVAQAPMGWIIEQYPPTKDCMV